MPLPLIGGLMAGLEAFLARFAVDAGLRAAAGQAAKTVGKQAVAEFIQAKAVPKTVRVFRGVPAASLPSEFAAPVTKEAPKVAYQSSLAEARKAAGEGGRVFSMNLPRNRLADYSPSPVEGGGMRYEIPYAEHYRTAKRSAMVDAAMRTPLGRVARAMFGSPPSPALQPAAQARTPVATPIPANPPAVQSSKPTATTPSFQPTGSMSQRTASWTSYFVRNWMAGGGSSTPNYPPGRSWSSTVRNFFSNVASGNSWRSSGGGSGGTGGSGGFGGGSGSPPPSGGGTSSYPNINPSALVAMMGRPQPQIAAANAAVANQQQQAQVQLSNTTTKLSRAFQMLAGTTGKAAAAVTSVVSAGVGFTHATGAAIDSRIDDRSRFHPAYAGMKIQRQVQEINLSRRLANETAPSAQRLNSAQMEGREQLNSMWSKIEPALNNLLTLGQHGVNKLLVIADKVLLLDQLASINRTLEKLFGLEEKKDKDEMQNLAHNLIDIARRSQQQNRQMKQKKPLEGIK